MLKDIVLFDTEEMHANLLPLSYTRPVADFRVGITTLKEKWQMLLPGNYSYLPVEYLRSKFCGDCVTDDDTLYIAANVVADEVLAVAVSHLKKGERLEDADGLLAFRGNREQFESDASSFKVVKTGGVRRVRYVYDIFLLNASVMKEDYKRIVGQRRSIAPDVTTQVIGPAETSDGYPSIFIEEGAVVEGAIISVKDGPVYIGRQAVVMPGSLIKGPTAICDNAKVRMGAKIYGGTTIGPYCKCGGELDNAVMLGYSNKAHDGYLGNAVIGEWCNIGAGVNASNLKNDYSKIRIWNYASRSFMRTNLQFCGLIMGDHSKAGINCMFNTATVVGVGVNLHGAGFPRVFIPSFSEGSPEGGFSNVRLDKFNDIAARVMARRDIILSEDDKEIYRKIYDAALQYKK